MSSDFSETEKQIQTLKDFIKSHPDPREMRRTLAVKLALECYGYRKIQNILEVSIGFISKWRKPFEFGGISALKSGHKGAKRYLSIKEEQAVIEWLLEQQSWDIPELEVYLIEQYEVVFQSRKSYYQLLNKARITWQKGEQFNPRQDKELISK